MPDQATENRLTRDWLRAITTHMECFGLASCDIERCVRSLLAPRRRRKDCEIQINERHRARSAQACVFKVFFYETELGQDGLVADLRRTPQHTDRFSAAPGSLTELKNSVAAAVTRARIEPIALHQSNCGEVIWREFEAPTDFYDFVLYCLALGWIDISPFNSPIKRPLQLWKRCGG
ncbi:MAG: hypothetical protein ACKO8O_22705 [Betaproteobacteria bacterium]